MIKNTFFLIIFFTLFHCSKNNDELVDYKSFLNEGIKVQLYKDSNLIEKDISKIKKLKLNYFQNYVNWPQSYQNSQNLIYPSKINFDQKEFFSKTGNFYKLLIYKKKIISLNNKFELIIYDAKLKKINSIKIYKKKLYKNFNLNLDIAVNENKIIISDNLGYIYCFDLKSLKLVWKKNFGVPFKSNIKIYKKNIYIINSNSKIFSIDLTSGKLNWSFETSSNIIKNNSSYQIALFNDLLFFTNDAEEIFCLDLKSNTIKWTLVFELENFYKKPLIFNSSPITIDKRGNLYISTNFGKTYSINSEKGSVNWFKPIVSLNRISISDDYLFILSLNRFLILDKSTGDILKNVRIENSQIKKNKKFILKDILLTKEKIHIFSDDGYSFSFNNKNLQDYKIKKIIDNYSSYLVVDNFLYLYSKNTFKIF